MQHAQHHQHDGRQDAGLAVGGQQADQESRYAHQQQREREHLLAAVFVADVAEHDGADLNAARYYNLAQVSADYRLGPQLRVGALYGVLHDTSGGGASARGFNFGGYYDLSRRTQLYTFASQLKNDPRAGFRFSGSAGPSANLAGADVNGKKLTGLQIGILHKF